MAKPDQQNIR